MAIKIDTSTFHEKGVITLVMTAGDFDALRKDSIFARRYWKDRINDIGVRRGFWRDMRMDTLLTARELEQCYRVLRDEVEA